MKKNILAMSIIAASTATKLPRGEGEDDDKTTYSKEEFEAAIASAVTKAKDEATSSMSAKNQELLNEMKKTKNDMKRYEGIDPDQVKTMMKAFEENQDLKDISEGKHEDVINRRIEKERSKFTSDINNLSEKAQTLEQQNQSLVQKVSTLMIDNNVVSEFIKEKGEEGAIEDVILRAQRVFKVENDELIPRDANDEIITGKNGPMTINEWIGELKQNAEHLFQGSKSSGVGGGGPAGNKTGLAAKIAAAASSGDMDEYKRLRKLQKEGKTA